MTVDNIASRGVYRGVSRRDFLKIGGLALGIMAASRVPGSAEAMVSVEEAAGSEPIVTKTATYHPILERHDKPMAYSTILKERKVCPDLHLVELVAAKSAKDFLQSRPMDIVLGTRVGADGQSFGTILDMQTIYDFGNEGVDVAYEGISVPEMTAREKIIDLFTGFDEDPIRVQMRSVLFARKLQFLGEQSNHSSGEKPSISYQLGIKHGEKVRELLQAGPTATLAELDQFSDLQLARLIEANGGIEPLCTTMVIDIKEASRNPGAKSTLIDQDLQEYLDLRFSKSNY